MKAFLEIVYYPLQWTWGIIQNIVGAVLVLVHAGKPHWCYGKCVATEWNRSDNMAMGMFIFLSKNLRGDIDDPESERSQVAVHEYGHTFQSALLGPFFLPVICAVSGIWCNLPQFEKLRREKHISYYRCYTERWANHLGKKITRKTPHGYWETHSRSAVSEDGLSKEAPESGESRFRDKDKQSK